MKILFLIILASINVYAAELGDDSLAGKVSVEVSEGPPIFLSKVTTKQSTNPWTTDPFIYLSAYETCRPYDLVPRFLDLSYERSGENYLAKRHFKCFNGDGVDWKRAIRWYCHDLKSDQQALSNYCKSLGDRFGKDTVQCNGRCEMVQDKTIFQQ